MSDAGSVGGFLNQISSGYVSPSGNSGFGIPTDNESARLSNVQGYKFNNDGN